jgi:hypothetical protein
VSAAVGAAAVAVMLLAPAPSIARGGAGAAGHAGGFHPPVRPIHPPVRPTHLHRPFVHHRDPLFVHHKIPDRHPFRFGDRRHHHRIFWVPGGFAYAYPVTYADDSAFYGTYYDPSDVTGWIGGPAYAVPPASVVPIAERLDRPVDRGACRSETVPVPTPGGAERSVTITRC